MFVVLTVVGQSNLFVCGENLFPPVAVSQLVVMENQPAEYWIKHLGLVEHPGQEDGYFAVPFEDTFSVRNRKKVNGRARWPQ